MKFLTHRFPAPATRLLLPGAFLLLLAAFGAGCSDSDNNLVPDNTAPVVSGTPSASSVSPFSAVISWSAASDETTGASALSYKVVRAPAAADIDTVAEADAVTGEGIVEDWTAGITSAAASLLLSDTTYHFAVLVRDAAGNMSLYAPVEQKTAAIAFPKVTNLSNGNLLLAYKDLDDGGKGKTVVFDGTGQYVAGPTTVVPGGVKTGYATNIGLITHGTGVPVLSYVAEADYTGHFVVLDNDGGETVGPEAYMNERVFFTGALAGGSGNSLFLAAGRIDHYAADQQGGGYAVYNMDDASQVLGVTEFNHGGGNDETRGVAASAIGADRFFLLYTQGWSALTPRFVIYDEAGAVQVADSAFATTKSNTYQVVKLADNNAFVPYIDLNDSNKGKFAVYQSTGALAVAATTFADVTLNNDWLAATVTGDGYVFIAYSDGADGNKAKYVVHDGTGALVTSATDLSSGAAYPCSAATLANDSIAMVSFLSGNVYSLQYVTGN